MNMVTSRMRVLDVDECMTHLRTHLPRIGRIALIEDGRPIILPVNYVYADGAVIFRSDPGAKLTAALRNEMISFQIDEIDTTWQEGWSVLVSGRAEEVRDAEEVARLRMLPLHPWAGDKAAFIRLLPGEITGRSLV